MNNTQASPESQLTANKFLFSEQPGEEECKAVENFSSGLTSTTKLLLALAEQAVEYGDETAEELLREFAERMAMHEAVTF